MVFGVHSAQLGLEEIVLEICALSDFNVILEDVSRRRNSWRFEGGRVKRSGRDMIALVAVLTWYSLVNLLSSIRRSKPTAGM